VLALLLNLYGVGWGLPGQVDWAVDSLAPTEPLRYLKMVAGGETWWSKYPAFHYMVVAAVQAPYVAFLLATGRLRLGGDAGYTVADPDSVLGTLTLLARLVSVAMGAGLTLVTFAVTEALFHRRAAVFAALLVCLSPLAIYYSHNANVDVPYVFWSGVALWALLRVVREGRTRHWVLLGVSAALALATKDQAYGLFLVVPAILAVARLREGGGPRALLGDRRLAACALATAATYAVASNLAFNFSGWVTHVRYIAGAGSAPYQTFAASPAGYLGLALATLDHLAGALNVPALAACAAGVALCLARRRSAAFPLLLGLSYVVSFLGVVLYVLPRFVLPLVLLLVPYGGYALAELWRQGRRPGQVAVAALLLYSLAYGASLDLEFTHDARYEAEAWIAREIPAGSLVGTDAQPTYLPRLPASLAVVPVALDGELVWQGSRPPDFLVLSSAKYRQYRRTARGRDLGALLGGGLGYRTVAHFSSRRFLGPRLIPGLSPDIVILARTSEPDIKGKS